MPLTISILAFNFSSSCNMVESIYLLWTYIIVYVYWKFERNFRSNSPFRIREIFIESLTHIVTLSCLIGAQKLINKSSFIEQKFYVIFFCTYISIYIPFSLLPNFKETTSLLWTTYPCLICSLTFFVIKNRGQGLDPDPDSLDPEPDPDPQHCFPPNLFAPKMIQFKDRTLLMILEWYISS